MDRRDFIARLTIATVLPSFPPGLYGHPLALQSEARMPAAGADALTPAELGFIRPLAEQIIPKTQTPGANEAGVPQFLAMLYSEWMLPAEQIAFRKGIRSLNDECIAAQGRGFADCSSAEQITWLRKWDAAAFPEVPAAGPPHFFSLLKQLVITAYYTSEVGENAELHTVLDAGENETAGPVMISIPLKF